MQNALIPQINLGELQGLLDTLSQVKQPGALGTERESNADLRVAVERYRESDLAMQDDLGVLGSIIGDCSADIKHSSEKPPRTPAAICADAESFREDRPFRREDSFAEQIKVLGQIKSLRGELLAAIAQLADEKAATQEQRYTLESAKDNIERRLRREDSRSWIEKIFRRGSVKALNEELETNSGALEALSVWESSQSSAATLLRDTSSRFEQFESNWLKAAIQTFFHQKAGELIELADLLFAPAIRREWNSELIAKRLEPKLRELEEKEYLPSEIRARFLELVWEHMNDAVPWSGPWPPTAESAEVEERRKQRMAQFDLLKRVGSYQLGDVACTISVQTHLNADPPDQYYHKILVLLLKELGARRVSACAENLSRRAADADTKDVISRCAARVIDADYDYLNPRFDLDESLGALPVAKQPARDLLQLGGLERWEILKSDPRLAQIISPQLIADVERTLIESLANQHLFPGGYESWDGTAAVGQMGQLGSPLAIPVLLKHIQRFGSGHTSAAAYFVLTSLLERAAKPELDAVLSTLSTEDRQIVGIIQNPKSYMSRFCFHPGYAQCALIRETAKTISQERLTAILERCGLDEAQLSNYYTGFDSNNPTVNAAFLAHRDDVEAEIVRSRLTVWSQSAAKLLEALLNPRNGNSSSLPMRLVQEGLGIDDPETCAAFESMLGRKPFSRSAHDRLALTRGLIMLNSRDDGREVFEELISRMRGAGRDPERLLRVLSYLSALESLGDKTFVRPPQEELEALHVSLEQYNSQLSSTVDRAERKVLKDRIETTQRALYDLTGLRGIEEACRKRLVETAMRSLRLDSRHLPSLERRFDSLLRSDFFEIVPALAANYELKNNPRLNHLLRQITERVVEDDFKKWRYTHNASVQQLGEVGPEMLAAWQESIPPVSVKASASDKELQSARAATVRQIALSAIEHVRNIEPGFDFEDWSDQADPSRGRVAELLNHLRTISDSEAAAATVSGKTAELEPLLERCGFAQAAVDISQVRRIFVQPGASAISATDTDDPISLFKVGTEPLETCQSWRKGSYNECLLAYVADGDKRVVNLSDEHGQVVGRSIIRLTKMRDPNDFSCSSAEWTIHVEPLYLQSLSDAAYRTYFRALLMKSEKTNAPLALPGGLTEQARAVLHDELMALGYEASLATKDIYLAPSANSHVYSDSLGGVISYFNTWKSAEVLCVRKRVPGSHY